MFEHLPQIIAVTRCAGILDLAPESFGRDPALVPSNLLETADLEPLYFEGEFPVGWSSYMEIEPFTSYVSQDVIDCKGPGE